MRRLALAGILAAALAGCGEKEDPNANAAPPPGPNAVKPPAEPNGSKLSPAGSMGGIGQAGSK